MDSNDEMTSVEQELIRFSSLEQVKIQTMNSNNEETPVEQESFGSLDSNILEREEFLPIMAAQDTKEKNLA